MRDYIHVTLKGGQRILLFVDTIDIIGESIPCGTEIGYAGDNNILVRESLDEIAVKIRSGEEAKTICVFDEAEVASDPNAQHEGIAITIPERQYDRLKRLKVNERDYIDARIYI